MLAALPELQVISKYGVGLDMIDCEALECRGVALAWAPGVNARSVAELTVAFMISLVHRLPESMAIARAGGWRQIVGRQLSDRTVGIVGCGHVGKEVVRLLQPFGCRLFANDVLDFPAFYASHQVTPTSRSTTC